MPFPATKLMDGVEESGSGHEHLVVGAAGAGSVHGSPGAVIFETARRVLRLLKISHWLG